MSRDVMPVAVPVPVPARVPIPIAALAAIAAHARADAPRECCGLLVGVEGPILRIERAVPTRNIAPGNTRYLIDPADHFRLLRETRDTPFAIIGAYHSHPGSAPVPSPTDLAESLPNFLYLIAAPRPDAQGRDTRAWWLDGRNFREIPLVPVP